MPLSDKKLAANLANAILLEGESRPQFIALLNSSYAELQPKTPSERALVDKLGVYQWLLLRTLTLESAAIKHEMLRRSETDPDEPALSRATGRFDRHYHRTLEALHRIKALQRIKEKRRVKNIQPKTTQLIENKQSDPEIESHETH